MEKLIYKHLIENGVIQNTKNEVAANTIAICNKKEVVISGNKLGLIELADYILNVALTEIENYHLHLDKTNFFDNSDLELVIIKE